jgi:hypothetical protein
MNLDNIGVSTLKDSTAFKKIQFFSKTNPTNLFNVKSDFQNSFNRLNNYYLTDLDLNNSYTYGMDRQHTYTSLASSLPNNTTLLDNNSVKKFFNYNFDTQFDKNINPFYINRLDYSSNNSLTSYDENFLNSNSSILPSKFLNLNSLDFNLFLKIPNITSVLSAENDSKQYSNSFKFLLNFKHKKKNIHNLNFLLNFSFKNDFFMNNSDPKNLFSSSLFNTENTLKFKDYKSSLCLRSACAFLVQVFSCKICRIWYTYMVERLNVHMKDGWQGI